MDRKDLDADFQDALRRLELTHNADMAWNIWGRMMTRIEELEADNKKIIDFSDDMMGRYQYDNLRLSEQLQELKEDRDRIMRERNHYYNLCQDALGILEYQRSTQAAINILRLGLDENN